jgi:hypothetical protein
MGAVPATVAVKVTGDPPLDGSVPAVRATVVVVGELIGPTVTVPGPLKRVSSLWVAIELDEP